MESKRERNPRHLRLCQVTRRYSQAVPEQKMLVESKMLERVLEEQKWVVAGPRRCSPEAVGMEARYYWQEVPAAVQQWLVVRLVLCMAAEAPADSKVLPLVLSRPIMGTK